MALNKIKNLHLIIFTITTLNKNALNKIALN